MTDEFPWKSICWSDYCCPGTVPTDLAAYVEKFIEGAPEEREEARDLFRQWPVDSRKLIGRLGAIPKFLEVLRWVVAEDRIDADLDIDLLTCFVSFLPDYVGEADFYEGCEEEYRHAVLREVSDAKSVLLHRLSHDRQTVQQAAIRFFTAWCDVPELEMQCTPAVDERILWVAGNSRDPTVLSLAIVYLAKRRLVDESQLWQYQDSLDLRLHLTASWALCEVGGPNRYPECLETLCKYSMAATFPIAEATDRLEALGHQGKWELTQLANGFLYGLGKTAELMCSETLMTLANSFDERNLFFAYRILLDNLFREFPKRMKESQELRSAQAKMIKTIVSNDRIWDYSEMAERWGERLRYAGLPDSRQALRGYSK